MKQLYFIRHGQSAMNISDQWSGSSDTPLTSTGVQQAKAAGQHAKQQGLAFDVIITSPLQRAHHTAQHVAQAIDHPIQDIIVHKDLVERDFGELEGTINHDAVQTYIQGEHLIDSFNNVESLVDMQARADAFMEYVMSLPQDTVLLVSHSAFGRALRRSIHKMPLTERGESFENAKITRLI